MHDAAFNVVRLSEFAWCCFEPEEDVTANHYGRGRVYSVAGLLDSRFCDDLMCEDVVWLRPRKM